MKLTREAAKLKEQIADRAKGLNLAIATPSYEMKEFTPYVDSLAATLRLLWELGIESTRISLSSDSYVDRAKNSLMTRVHKSGDHTHIMYIDSDMSWNAEAVLAMLLADKEMIAGAYPLKNGWKEYGVIVQMNPDRTPIVENGLIKADQVSGGFTMYSMAAIDRMVSAYPGLRYYAVAVANQPEEEYYDFFSCTRQPYEDGKTRYQGEDVTFCRRFKAAGGEMWIYPDVSFRHYGIKGWAGNYHQFMLRQPGGSEYTRLPWEVE